MFYPRELINQLNISVWAKDKNFKYLFCNETYARAANLDSPYQIVGKSDEDLPWRSQANYFREGDNKVLQGSVRINCLESEIQIHRVADILVSENQLFNNENKCIGIIGSYVDVTDFHLTKKVGYFDLYKKRYYLGPSFNHAFLTLRETEVFRHLLLGYSARQSAQLLRISNKTVESYINNIKVKLQANTKGDLIYTAIQYGLTQVIHLNLTCPNDVDR